VTAFVEHLRASLNAALGTFDPDRIWWDRTNIDESLPLTTQIRDQVTRSQLLVILLSPGYCKSRWCREEREAFLRHSPNALAQGRVVLVDLGTLGRDNRPTEFGDLRGHLFFSNSENHPDRGQTLGFPRPVITEPSHARYFIAVHELAEKLAEKLADGLPSNSTATPSPRLVPHPGIRVFVAQATDDVADERDDVARYLADHFTVSTAFEDAPVGSLPDWNSRLTQALQQADVFVQLVGSVPGRKLFGSEQRPVVEQFLQARQAGKKMFLWRSADPEEIADAALREVLTAAEYCHSIQEFRETIVRQVTPPPPVPVQKLVGGPSSDEARSIFIQAGVEDADQADQLSDLLAGCNCFAQLPLQTGTPEEIRADLEENLDSCDGVILLYGKIPVGWMKAQFRELPRHFSRRRKKAVTRPIPALAVYEGDPPDKPDPGVNAPGLQWIECADPQFQTKLREWVATIGQGSAS
jgi:hypothetical protein